MLFASDLDGTLLGPGSRLTERTIDLLAEVRDAGIPVVAITGRSPVSTLALLGGVGAVDVALCNNGAVELDITHATIRSAELMPSSSVAAFLAEAPLAMPGLALAWEHDSERQHGYGWDDAFEYFTSDFEFVPGRASVTLDPERDRITKLMIGHPELDAYALATALAAAYVTDLEISTSGAPFLEATAPGVNKATALAKFAANCGVDQNDVVAYGDNQNDVAMLRWAGTGVAVGNAHPLAVEAADVQIGHHADDAVALDMVSRAKARR